MKNDQLSETILNEETVYQGKFLKVTHAEVSLPNGHTSGRDMVRHPGGVVIVAIGEEDEVYLEHQYRTPLERETLEILTNFGDGGRQPGLWYAPHSIVTDSKGNIYTTETYDGKRIQKFVYQGLKAIPKNGQGVAWPSKEL